MTDLDALFSAVEAGESRIVPLVVLDWHDGPLEGFADVGDDDRCWHFKMVADRFRTDDLDDRVFLFAQLSAEMSTIVRAAEGDAGQNRSLIEQALAAVGSPLFLVHAASFSNVEAVWRWV